jgi:hypothetical protein
MRQASRASLCHHVLATFVLALLLAGCGGTVPATPRPAVRPLATFVPAQPANPWGHLQTQVGNYPFDGADFLRSGPLAERLVGLLGRANYNVLLENLRVSGPLRQDGDMLYITGNRPHDGAAEAAAIVVHSRSDAVRVWLLTGGEEWDVQDQGTPKALPADVAKLMDGALR